MASSTVHQEVTRAKRIVERLREIEQAERHGEVIPQTYTPAPLLLPGQQVHTIASPPPRRTSLVVVFNISPDSMAKVATSARYPGTPTTSSTPRVTATTLVSIRMKTTLSRLRQYLKLRSLSSTRPAHSLLIFY
jgi:hypothetical protein